MSIKRRDLIKSFGLLTASSAFATAGVAQNAPAVKTASTKRPNILVFLSDDHAQWLQQAYGNSEVHTPNMDRIARNGMRMTNAFTETPVCSPARASFFTGRMPSQHGIHDWINESTDIRSLPSLGNQILISDLLRKAGYHTGLVGKWHCGEERQPHSGFDYWYSYWVGQYPHRGEQNFSDNGKHVTPNGFQSPLFTNQALEFLRTHYTDKQTAEKPFFLFISYTDTHAPHAEMPEDLVSLYKDSTFRDVPIEKFNKVHGTAMLPISPDPEKDNNKRRQSYAAASSIDREVGKVLDELQSKGTLADTLVVYTGDHGVNCGQHGIWEKGNATVPQNFLEESIRIPCAVSWPNGGIPQNLECELPVNHCDLFQTLLEAAQAVPDARTRDAINSPGRSYLSQLHGGGPGDWRDNVISEYGNARMIRKNGYKLILRYPYKGLTFPNELYDLKADPRENTNLYTDSSYAQTVRDLSSQVESYFATYTVAGQSGLDLEHQPVANPESPWLRAEKMNATSNG
jgi:arylsulfatase A-like enzyme